MLPDDFEPPSENRVGTTLCGKYRIDSVLGVGGMATVYAATHRSGCQFAIKILHPTLAARPALRARFLREAYATNVVKHRGVVNVLDDNVADDGALFLVMELLHGHTAEALAEREGGRLGVRAAVGIVEQLLDALAAAHDEGIVHRDVKPANVFVTREGEVKVLDFGIARLRDSIPLDLSRTSGAAIMGTPAYMAPEHALPGMEAVDARSDVWSAGATLYALLSGRSVHEGETAAEVMIKAASERALSLEHVAPRAPRAIIEVVDCALAFEKALRWSSAREMRIALLAAHRLHFGRSPSREDLGKQVRAEIPARGRISSIPALAPTEDTTAVPSVLPEAHPTSPSSAPHAITDRPPAPRARRPRVGWGIGIAAAAVAIASLAAWTGQRVDAPSSGVSAGGAGYSIVIDSPPIGPSESVPTAPTQAPAPPPTGLAALEALPDDAAAANESAPAVAAERASADAGLRSPAPDDREKPEPR